MAAADHHGGLWNRRVEPPILDSQASHINQRIAEFIDKYACCEKIRDLVSELSREVELDIAAPFKWYGDIERQGPR